MLTLEITKREKTSKLENLREKGLMPAVFYGRKEKSTSISIPEKEFTKVWKKAGESSIVVLKDGAIEHEALIHEVDLDPVKGNPRHADFYVIEKGKKLKLEIPLEFTGTSEAVKTLGGILVKVLHDLEIEALPKDLPHSITIDISALSTLESVITAGSIKLPEGVTLISGADEVVAAITVAKEEEEVTAPVDVANIELSVEKGKKEEEGAEGAAAPAGKEEKKEAKK